MNTKLLYAFFAVTFIACNSSHSSPLIDTTAAVKDTTTNLNPYRIICNIPLPNGFTRLTADSNSFGSWLRNVGLKKDKTVYLYNGTPKENQSAQFAVLNISTGKTDLQQCADAVMRLRAEYLYANKRYNEIVFTDNEKGTYRFDEPYTDEHFHKYLEQVFAMCGSASLSKQLRSKPIENIQPGDVLIRGGFPGHAVIVMDVAINKEGKKIYLIAQSYMPAQDIHVLNNPMNKDISPWYEVNDEKFIETPEYRFTRDELKTW